MLPPGSGGLDLQRGDEDAASVSGSSAGQPAGRSQHKRQQQQQQKGWRQQGKGAKNGRPGLLDTSAGDASSTGGDSASLAEGWGAGGGKGKAAKRRRVEAPGSADAVPAGFAAKPGSKKNRTLQEHTQAAALRKQHRHAQRQQQHADDGGADSDTDATGALRMVFGRGAGAAPLTQADWERMAIKGTCETVEKRYFRLIAAPDPSAVRPQPVLERAFDLVMARAREGASYKAYVCDQLKSLRQDLTVQGIRNAFTVRVYEAHARLALEHRDAPEFVMCLTQLSLLHRAGLPGCVAEFLAYRLIYFLYAGRGADADALALMRALTPSQLREPAILHALEVRTAYASRNYARFFALQRAAPGHAGHLMRLLAHRIRLWALKAVVAACKPTLPLPFLTTQLDFASDAEAAAWIARAGGALKDEGPGADAGAGVSGAASSASAAPRPAAATAGLATAEGGAAAAVPIPPLGRLPFTVLDCRVSAIQNVHELVDTEEQQLQASKQSATAATAAERHRHGGRHSTGRGRGVGRRGSHDGTLPPSAGAGADAGGSGGDNGAGVGAKRRRSGGAAAPGAAPRGRDEEEAEDGSSSGALLADSSHARGDGHDPSRWRGRGSAAFGAETSDSGAHGPRTDADAVGGALAATMPVEGGTEAGQSGHGQGGAATGEVAPSDGTHADTGAAATGAAVGAAGNDGSLDDDEGSASGDGDASDGGDGGDDENDDADDAAGDDAEEDGSQGSEEAEEDEDEGEEGGTSGPTPIVELSMASDAAGADL
jgi:hypothetical protein